MRAVDDVADDKWHKLGVSRLPTNVERLESQGNEMSINDLVENYYQNTVKIS